MEAHTKTAPDVDSTTPATSGVGVPLEQCQLMVQKALRTPMAKFLRDRLGEAGCNIGDAFFKAMNCDDERWLGAYSRGIGVKVCCNQVTDQDDVNQAIIHELIHAYDDCRASNLDWTNCMHHACSEIRASHLSGDCHYKRELLRGHIKMRGHEPECVRRRAMKSMRLNPCCSEATSNDAVDAVWDICYNDTKPFDKAP